MNNTTVMSNKSMTNSNFGRWGWSMIIFSFLCYFFWAGLGTDGLNIYPSAFAGVHGWDAATLLAYATPAGILGIIGGFVFGELIIKFKPRKIAAFTLIVSGVCYAIFGMSPSPAVYAIMLILFTFFSTGFGLIVTSTLMADWFPRKKGIALGWATMGAPVCTALFVPLLSMLLGKFGLTNAFLIMGGLVVVFGISSIFWVKDYPEEVGALPDNLPMNKDLVSNRGAENYVSTFTVAKLLKDKDLWLISLGFGLLWLVTVGIVSQFIPRMMSVGFALPDALKILTISALIAVPGSYFWGWLDQKIGTKFASVIYSVSYIIALILLILQTGTATIYIATIFVGLGLGGLLNLMPSMVISVYGRYDFMAANRLVAPIASIVRVLTFVIMAALLAISKGDYTLPYSVFIVIDVVGAVLLLLVTNKCKGKQD